MRITYIKEYHRDDLTNAKGDLVHITHNAVKQIIFTSKYIFLYNASNQLIGTPIARNGIYSHINNICIEELRKEQKE